MNEEGKGRRWGGLALSEAVLETGSRNAKQG